VTRECFQAAFMEIGERLAESVPAVAAGEHKAMLQFAVEILPVLLTTVKQRMEAIHAEEVERFHQLEDQGRAAVCITQ